MLDSKILTYLQNKQKDGYEDVEFVKERDYSIYKINGIKRYGLNKTLLRAIEINTNEKLFEEQTTKRFELFNKYV
jgi:hypothetical protein